MYVLSLFADLSRKGQSVGQFPVRNMLRSPVRGLHEWRSAAGQRKTASVWAGEQYESFNTKGGLECSRLLFLAFFIGLQSVLQRTHASIPQ